VNVQSAFDSFYSATLELLNYFYPERVITVSSRDPTYITPSIKAMLRRKNRLMRSGRVEEASALAKHIGRSIAARNMKRLKRDGGSIDAKDMWDAVRHLTGRKQEDVQLDGANAESFNVHYANISTDPDYRTLGVIGVGTAFRVGCPGVPAPAPTNSRA